MRDIVWISLLTFCLACAPEGQKTNKAGIKPPFSVAVEVSGSSALPNEVTEQEDCIFNNDLQSLTTTWLKELAFHNYSWDTTQNLAKISFGKDTIYARKGGCQHFETTVVRKFYQLEIPFEEERFWFEAARELASLFELQEVAEALRSDHLKLKLTNEQEAWLIVDDLDMADNLYFEGVELTRTESYLEVAISQYFD
ncbi:MAG: hypothetical protein AAF433_19155 [Bacteroidota bacterium]